MLLQNKNVMTYTHKKMLMIEWATIYKVIFTEIIKFKADVLAYRIPMSHCNSWDGHEWKIYRTSTANGVCYEL